jgi:predicted AAA+ superfamily ATPase
MREIRNAWAHQQAFTTDDAYRALDTASRLLATISASEQAAEVERQKQEVLRLRFEDQAKRETRKASVAAIEGQPMGGLKPWREIITPHPDVASGRYQQAEFAADLGQVYRGEGSSEYRDPREFFQRTYLTEGLKLLLTGALRRLADNGGDPVVELQTNFGGGKTHSMLALYHLFSGTSAGELAGIEPVLQAAGVSQPPKANRAVLVGTALDPSQARIKSDGTEVRTFWGEMAWQLLGKEGFEMVAEADRHGVSPGSDTLRELFKRSSPSLILIDEWIAYFRNVYGTYGLPSGSFDANMTFAQSLTEAAKAAPGTLLVASIPASDIEIGGMAGREALERLKNTFGRIESAWRPASAEEGFEIVRRRLFQSVDPQQYAARDAVVRAFAELYRSQPQEFPSTCREGDYQRRIEAAYPIHPELFDRLYNDWSALDKFQRTRGVLRLMAAVIHSLWERQDSSLLIMPASIPIDESAVQFELTRYLEDNWVPVIEGDIDGPNSLPLRLDRDNPNFGRYSATRRVARTLYVGSAPTLKAAHRGLEDKQIKLGCVQPGENPATFGDALRRLSDQATFLYVDNQRYWYATQPSVTRLAADRASQFKEDDVYQEIRKRLQEQSRSRGDFVRVHVCPGSPADVPDERDARLVILDPAFPHTGKNTTSPAHKAAEKFLAERGAGPRIYRNTLVFLAADKTRLEELDSAVRQYMAWSSIEAERDTLNLDPFQASQARTKREQADQTVKLRIPETYSWLVVPGQAGDPQSPVQWEKIRLQGQDDLAPRASRKLVNEDMLTVRYAGTPLRMKLDAIPLWRGNHVGVKQLVDDFAQYLYLPRLQSESVLLDAVSQGPGNLMWERETFAYAEGWDEQSGRYMGLAAGRNVTAQQTGLLVKPDAAIAQFEHDEAVSRATPTPSSGGSTTPTGVTPDSREVEGGTGKTPPQPVSTQPRRFYATVKIDPRRLSTNAGTISEEIVQHLAGLIGADVEVTLDIRAFVPGGAPDHVVRTVTENCRTLGFQAFGFEDE